MTAVYIDTPYLSADEYARRTGLKRETVIAMCREGKLPVAPREKDGARFLVNNALLTKQALEATY